MSERTITLAEVEAAVKHYVPYLGLTDWLWKATLNVPDGQDGGAGARSLLACVEYRPSNQSFVLTFNAKQFGTPDLYGGEFPWWMDFLRVIVHELLHVVWAPVLDAYEEELTLAVGIEGRDLFRRAVYNMEDAAVDRLARLVVRYAPRMLDANSKPTNDKKKSLTRKKKPVRYPKSGSR